jgi:hypothetical protein
LGAIASDFCGSGSFAVSDRLDQDRWLSSAEAVLVGDARALCHLFWSLGLQLSSIAISPELK